MQRWSFAGRLLLARLLVGFALRGCTRQTVRLVVTVTRGAYSHRRFARHLRQKVMMIAARTRRSDCYEASGAAWYEIGSAVRELKDEFVVLIAIIKM